LKLNNTLLNNWKVNKKKQKGSYKYFKLNESKHTTYKKLLCATTSVTLRRFVLLNPYIRKERCFPVNDFKFYVKTLENKLTKGGRGEKIRKSFSRINEI
jgi:hypothetical protein